MDREDVFDQFSWLSTEIQALVGHLLAIGGSEAKGMNLAFKDLIVQLGRDWGIYKTREIIDLYIRHQIRRQMKTSLDNITEAVILKQGFEGR